MKYLLKFLPVFLVFLIIFLFFNQKTSFAITQEECTQRAAKNELNALGLEDLKTCTDIFDQSLKSTTSQRRNLESEVKRFNTALMITTANISTTTKEIGNLEKEIDSLAGKIGKLDLSLDEVSKLLAERIAETYKKGKIDYLNLFFSSKNFPEFVSRFKYLKVIQLHDRNLMLQMETARTNFEDQKTLKEKKQQELETAKKKLESQKVLLIQQKEDKDRLLKETQGKEAQYQKMLAASQAEIEAIQGIIAGTGQETEVGKVGQGETIASIILGSSPCSTGTHLHFQVAEGSSVKNPLSYLRNISVSNDSGGDSFNATGSWDWPLNEPIKFNQGFGANTSAIRARLVWYDSHTGIDISSSDRVVKAVKTGTLFRGAIACGGGKLRYVRVRHDEGNLDSYYLHVNY